MSKEELLAKIPGQIITEADGLGEFCLHSYADKKFVAWYQFEYKVSGVCFAESWQQLYDQMSLFLGTQNGRKHS